MMGRAQGERFSVKYTINRMFEKHSLQNIEARARTALADSGFGVLTEIDMQDTMKQKLGIDMPPYRILGACHPEMAYSALEEEPRVGAMLPCNVIVRAVEGGIEVSAVDPVASMQAVDNVDLATIAREVRTLLAQAVETI